MQINRLRRTLKSGGIALGTLMWEIQGRGVVHTLAQAGMDFVMICTEHSAYNLETVVNLVAHAHAAGITPIVRIPDSDCAACQNRPGGAPLRRICQVSS